MWNTGDADVENDPNVRLYLRSSAMDQSSADQEPELTPEEITKHLTNHFGENVARAFEGQYLRTVQSRTNYNKKGFILAAPTFTSRTRFHAKPNLKIS